MSRTVAAALWICLVVIASAFGGTVWFLDYRAKSEEAYLDVVQYETTPVIYVPIVRKGRISGYVYAQFVFTADAAVLHRTRVEPGPFVANAALQYIYTDETLDFARLRKTDLTALTTHVRETVNARFGNPVVQDVLIEQFGYSPPRGAAPAG